MHPAIEQLKQAAIANGLRQSDLFADCEASLLEKIVALTSVRTLAKESILFQENSRPAAFFIVQQGALRLQRNSASGHSHLLHVFRPFESLAEDTLTSESGYAGTACATEPSQVLAVGKAGFLALLRSHPELSLTLLRSFAAQTASLIGRLEELTDKDVRTRLADWLLRRCSDPGSRAPQTVCVPHSKRLLASELGTGSETLSRTLARFRDQHLLQVRGRNLTLLCPARLAQSVYGQSRA